MLQDKFVLVDGTEIKESIVGVSWSTSSNSDSDITPGSVCASAVEIELWVSSDSALSVTQGTVLTYYKVDTEFGIETKLGVFTCDKPEKTGANKYKVTAYDNVTLLDVDVSEWLNALTFPITIKDFATALATKCELELVNEPRLNKDYQIQKFTGSGVNARDLMKMVCSASGCFCNADADGKLSFDWYKKNNKVAIAPRKSVNASSFYLFDVVPRSLQDNVPRAIVTTESGSGAPDGIPYFANQLTFSDFTVKEIDKVQVKQSDDDVGVIYPADAQGTNALVIQGNQLLSTTSDEELRPYVKNLYDGLNNITYVPCSNIQTPETLDIKVGDIVTVSDGKRQFETWITSVKHSGNRCTFESVGNANRNTTTAVNNTQYNARQKIAEIKASVDGISAKLSEYSTTEEMNAAIDIGIKKINISVAEKISSENLMDGFIARSDIYSSTTGSVTIDESGVATIVAPESSEPNGRNGVTYTMPDKNLNAVKGASITISLDYKVNETISVASSARNSQLAIWFNYASGNIATVIIELAKSGVTTEPSDWQTKTIKFTPKDEIPTRVYFYAYLSGGTGSISVKNPLISLAANKESVISLTKDGTVISAGELNLNQFATNTELKVGIDGLSATVVKNGEVRSKFALDSSSCTIESGVVAFKGHTITIDSDNFKLYGDGTVNLNGSFKSHGTKGNINMYDGRLYMDSLGTDGARYATVSLSRTVADNPAGHITVHGKGIDAVVLSCDNSGYGGYINLRDTSNSHTVSIYAGDNQNASVRLSDSGGTLKVNLSAAEAAYFHNGVKVRDELQLWGANDGVSKINAIGGQTTIRPRSSQNALYVDWQYFKTINGENVYALVGKTTPWA